MSSWQLAVGTEVTALGQHDVLPTSLPDLREWLMRRGAVDYGSTQVNLFLHGPQVGTGSVLDVRARVIRRHPPLTGSWLCSPMAGAVTAVPLMYDLDDDVARGWEGRQDGAVSRVGESPYFKDRRVVLNPGEQFFIQVRAEVTASYVEWELEVDLSSDKHKHEKTVRLRPGRTPFGTTNCPRSAFGSRWYCGVGGSAGGGWRRAGCHED